MGALLAPLARAFKGQLVEGEEHTTHKGAPGSRIIDFRVSKDPVGSCGGKGSNCAFNKPVACYTCFRFEPWLDAPHGKVLERLQAEREKWSADDRMAAVNDEPKRGPKDQKAVASSFTIECSLGCTATNYLLTYTFMILLMQLFKECRCASFALCP